jgi:hypothetical protein
MTAVALTADEGPDTEVTMTTVTTDRPDRPAPSTAGGRPRGDHLEPATDQAAADGPAGEEGHRADHGPGDAPGDEPGEEAASEPEPTAPASAPPTEPSTTTTTTSTLAPSTLPPSTLPPTSPPTEPPPPERSTVAVIGDSITVAMAPYLGPAFGSDWTVTVEAHGNDLYRDRLEAAARVAATQPDVVVVNLGTNDTACAFAEALSPGSCHHSPFDLADSEADQRELVSLFGPSTCVVGVRVVYGDQVDRVWDALVDEGRAAGVVAWDHQAAAHPEYLADSFGHLTVVGMPVLADALASGVDAFCD